MAHGHQLITPPVLLPVTLAEAKLHARVDTTAEDDTITEFIKAAVKEVEHKTGRQLITATWKMTFDCLPWLVELYRSPAQAITSVTYIDANGDEQTLDAAEYQLDASTSPARVTPANGSYWPVTQSRMAAAAITYTAGYGLNPTDVPENLRLAVKLLAAHWFEHREAVDAGQMKELPLAVQTLMDCHRVYHA